VPFHILDLNGKVILCPIEILVDSFLKKISCQPGLPPHEVRKAEKEIEKAGKKAEIYIFTKFPDFLKF
jgi:hypothetical protein